MPLSWTTPPSFFRLTSLSTLDSSKASCSPPSSTPSSSSISPGRFLLPRPTFAAARSRRGRGRHRGSRSSRSLLQPTARIKTTLPHFPFLAHPTRLRLRLRRPLCRHRQHRPSVLKNFFSTPRLLGAASISFLVPATAARLSSSRKLFDTATGSSKIPTTFAGFFLSTGTSEMC